MSYQFLLKLVDNEPRTQRDPKVQQDLDTFKWILSEYYSIVKKLQTIDNYRYTEEELAPTPAKDAIRADREARRVGLRADLQKVVDEMFETDYMKRWCPPYDPADWNKTNLHRINELKTRLLNF